MHVLVMAKAPIPGRVKTRLCPPCSAEQASHLAEAALADTLTAALDAGADRCLLALDGPPGPWLPAGVEVLAQRGDSFGARLDAAWAEAGGPGVQIGMDTPQVTGGLLAGALGHLDDGAECLLGPATDGGWWAIALRSAPSALFVPVPMSRPDTGELQRRRCAALGLTVEALVALRDVDTVADALAVARMAPRTHFAAAVADLDLDLDLGFVGAAIGDRAS